MEEYIFYWEDEGINGENSYRVMANGYLDAYDKAEDTLGPQMNDMCLVLAPKEQANSSNNP
jgi:hypothetical protein